MPSVKLLPLDHEVDPREILNEVQVAQAYWLGAGEEVPMASLVIAGLCRRLIVAEEKLRLADAVGSGIRRFENGSAVFPFDKN